MPRWRVASKRFGTEGREQEWSPSSNAVGCIGSTADILRKATLSAFRRRLTADAFRYTFGSDITGDGGRQGLDVLSATHPLGGKDHELVERIVNEDCEKDCSDSGEGACGNTGCRSAVQLALWCDAVRRNHYCNSDWTFTWPVRVHNLAPPRFRAPGVSSVIHVSACTLH